MLRGVDFVTSNVPGAPVPLYAAGAEIVQQFPFGPLSGAAANITLLSWLDQVCIGINVDPASVTDPPRLPRLPGRGLRRGHRRRVTDRDASAEPSVHRRRGRTAGNRPTTLPRLTAVSPIGPPTSTGGPRAGAAPMAHAAVSPCWRGRDTSLPPRCPGSAPGRDAA